MAKNPCDSIAPASSMLAGRWLCPNRSSHKLDHLSHNITRLHSISARQVASDFCCPSWRFWFQLKGQKSRLGDSITDGAYDAMMQAVRNDELPSFYFMQYELATWRVRNLLLVPHFAFPPSAIIKRKPLSSTARRAGWVGCNFALNRIPADARIAIVTTIASPRRRSGVAPDSDVKISTLSAGFRGPYRNKEFQDGDRRAACPTIIVPPDEVRERFKRVKPLKEISVKERGWTLDVLNAVRSLGKLEFTNGDAYTFAEYLEKLHPDNRHVHDKIRQQLQVLRDAGLLLHVERGVWRLP